MNALGAPHPDWWRAQPFDGARELLRRQGFEQKFTVD